MGRGLPWEFGRNLDFNIFSRKLAFICKKTCPKRWDYFRTEITTFSRSNLRKTAFSRVFIMSFSCYSLLNRFVNISCNFGPSTIGLWKKMVGVRWYFFLNRGWKCGSTAVFAILVRSVWNRYCSKSFRKLISMVLGLIKSC